MDSAALINSSTAQSAASQAQTRIAENFDTFLTLLTTQLQNQDPLEPMKSNEFTQQLVQFANVEQAIASNKNLEKLVNFSLASATSSAAGYLGKEISAGGETAVLSNGAARWNYTVGAGAKETAIAVTDASGSIIYSTKGQISEGLHTFDWDGRLSGGGFAANGSYRIAILATDQYGSLVPVQTNVKGIVNAVEFNGTEPLLSVGGIKLRIADITSITTPSSAPPDENAPDEETPDEPDAAEPPAE